MERKAREVRNASDAVIASRGSNPTIPWKGAEEKDDS